jgi:DNA-binding MarR family transcriptional regulator
MHQFRCIKIVARTGFPQSHVSTAVGRLREAGAVDTVTDPADRRRTLVRITHGTFVSVATHTEAGVEDIVAEALGADDPQVVAQVMEALELLAGRLLSGRGSGPARPARGAAVRRSR